MGGCEHNGKNHKNKLAIFPSRTADGFINCFFAWKGECFFCRIYRNRKEGTDTVLLCSHFRVPAESGRKIFD